MLLNSLCLSTKVEYNLKQCILFYNNTFRCLNNHISISIIHGYLFYVIIGYETYRIQQTTHIHTANKSINNLITFNLLREYIKLLLNYNCRNQWWAIYVVLCIYNHVRYLKWTISIHSQSEGDLWGRKVMKQMKD